VSLDTAVDVRKLPFVTCPNPRGYRPSLGSCDFSIRLKLYGETTYFQNRLIVMQCIVPKDWKLDLLAVLRENVHSFFLTILAPRRDTTAEVNIRRFKTKFQVFCPMLKWYYPLEEGTDWWTTRMEATSRSPLNSHVGGSITKIKCSITAIGDPGKLAPFERLGCT